MDVKVELAEGTTTFLERQKRKPAPILIPIRAINPAHA